MKEAPSVKTLKFIFITDVTQIRVDSTSQEKNGRFACYKYVEPNGSISVKIERD